MRTCILADRESRANRNRSDDDQQVLFILADRESRANRNYSYFSVLYNQILADRGLRSSRNLGGLPDPNSSWHRDVSQRPMLSLSTRMSSISPAWLTKICNVQFILAVVYPPVVVAVNEPAGPYPVVVCVVGIPTDRELLHSYRTRPSFLVSRRSGNP